MKYFLVCDVTGCFENGTFCNGSVCRRCDDIISDCSSCEFNNTVAALNCTKCNNGYDREEDHEGNGYCIRRSDDTSETNIVAIIIPVLCVTAAIAAVGIWWYLRKKKKKKEASKSSRPPSSAMVNVSNVTFLAYNLIIMLLYNYSL